LNRVAYDVAMPAPAAYSHVAIVVTDIDRCAAFYREVFGFVPAGRTFRGSGEELGRIMGVPSPTIEGLFMSCDGFVIELLHYVDGPPQPPRTSPDQPGYGHLSFVVDSVAERMRAAEAAGGSTLAGSRTPIPMGEATPVVMGFVADPEGNRIELIEHTDDSAAAAHARFLGVGSLGWPPSVR
jgi:catechol 2,3-dioxygenase-like lactoylglutathione lyase family enzyme